MSQTLRKIRGGLVGLVDRVLVRVLPRRVVVSVLKRSPIDQLLQVKNEINPVERMDYAPRDIFLHVDSAVEHSVRLNSCKKEPDTVRWIETFLREGDVLFDVGANVGAYSLVTAKYHEGRVKTYAFEPSFVNFMQLCKNVLLNDCQESVVPLPLALSDRTTIDKFNYRNLIPGSALHALGEAVDDSGATFQPEFIQYVLSYRIDDLVEQFSLPVPNHLKIDVDGIELAVLEGAGRTLADPSVRSIILEMRDDATGRRITEFLNRHCFGLHSRHERWTAGLFNYVFRREATGPTEAAKE